MKASFVRAIKNGFVVLIFIGCNRQPTTVVDAPAAPSLPAPTVLEPEVSRVEVSLSRFVMDDVASQWGLDFRYENGEVAGVLSIVESLGGGVGVLDFDLDGRQDIALTGGGQFHVDSTSGLPNSLFRNYGSQFQNVATLAELADCDFYSHGVCVGDYDNDGFRDIIISGYRGLALHKNMGDGTFEKVNSAGLPPQPLWCSSAAWGDFNQDGNLDLYVARYVNWSFENHPICTNSKNGLRDICPPKSFEALPDLLLFSDGAGGFRDASQESGLRADGKGLGVLAVDVDNDFDLDIYVANDTTDNFLYLNDGTGNFEEAGLKHGVAVDDRALPNGSMGIAACDYDRNGWIDLWVANYEREAFAMYQNQGHGHFIHASRRTGVTSLGGSYVGFGTEAVDLDMDGLQEILVANGHVIRYPSAAPRKQLPLLLANNHGRLAKEVFASGNYFSQPNEGRGLGTGDLNGDGVRDVVISHLNGPPALLLNSTPQRSPFISVRLIGTRANRDAIGTRVVIVCGGNEQAHQVVGGGSYLSSSDNAIQFPVVAGAPVSLRIHWNGSTVVQEVELNSELDFGQSMQTLPILQQN